MTPERWQKVERIFRAALDSAPSARSVLLDQLCEGDAELRQEIISLLDVCDGDDRFLESGALPAYSELLSRDIARTSVGNKMSPERFRQIRNLFEAALERSLEERAHFVEQASAGDGCVRRSGVC